MNSFFGFVSSYQIAGYIPLDLVCHLLVGTIWTVIGIYKNIDLKNIFDNRPDYGYNFKGFFSDKKENKSITEFKLPFLMKYDLK